MTRSPKEEFILRLKLDERVIPTRVKVARKLPGTLQGAKAYRYGVEFVSISADDWDAVVRWSKGGEAAEQRKQGEVGPRDGPHERRQYADRLMPAALAEQTVSGFIAARTPSRRSWPTSSRWSNTSTAGPFAATA